MRNAQWHSESAERSSSARPRKPGLAADDREVAQASFLAVETTKPTQGVGYDVSLNWESGGVLLSHGETPHYHRR